MLRRLCRALVVYHHRHIGSRVDYRDLLQNQTPACICNRQYSSRLKAALEQDYVFLDKYPDAVKYNESFPIKVQPFSINAPHFYLRNFINELGFTLKIPYVYEDGYSAAMCLEKICQKRERGSLLIKDAYEGITREEWHEIYLAIDDEIQYLDERTMVSLISLYFKVKEFNEDRFEKIYKRFSSVLTRRQNIPVKDLCLWSNILLENESFQPKYVSLLEQIWKKIETKSGKIPADDLMTVYRAIPPRFEEMYDTFYTDFKRELPSMKIYDLFMIGMELGTKSQRTNEFKLMIGWIGKKLKSQKISTEELQILMSNFTAREYVDEILLDILSIHLRKGKFMDKGFMKVTLDYSTLSRFYDENILEMACNVFIDSEDDYSYQDLALLLKAIGTLNHTPGRTFEFFHKVEAFMHREALLMKPETLLDFVEYLLYLDRPLFNLKEFIFSPSFQGLVKDIEKTDAEIYRKCLIQLHLAYQAFLEIGFDPFPRLDISDRDLYQRLNPHDYKGESVYNDVVDAMRRHVKDGKMGHFPRPTFLENYIELQFDTEGKMLETRHPERLTDSVYRKALLIVSDGDYCRKYGCAVSDHMLGSEAVNIKILEHQNVEVTVMRKNDILNGKRKNTLDKEVVRFLKPDPERFRKFQEIHSKKREKTNGKEKKANLNATADSVKEKEAELFNDAVEIEDNDDIFDVDDESVYKTDPKDGRGSRKVPR